MAFCPLLFAIAVAILLDDGGPVFYRQWRVGKEFVPFQLLKFRTMTQGADRLGALTSANDSRVTRIGRYLRISKLDELPQLVNVIRGDMQLVGARPEVPKYVEMFRKEYSEILLEPPGITDPASIQFRREEQLLSHGNTEEYYLAAILPRKLELSLNYQRNRTVFSDCLELARTAWTIVR